MDEYLWPARNIAEYAYCPRLFYLMEVEGIHISSADTEKGQAVHRRVNAPSTDSGVASDPDRPRAVRSLALTSSTLGLTATLDLAEIEDGCAIPVEYRKGRPYHPLPAAMNEEDDRGENVAPAATPLQPWPTDRVQVALQAILLEEHGYTVPAAVLYYAAEKRRLRIPVDDA
ncbi:MAG: Dna2/Cas4 domain-containing protein, partial [Gemmataceae bacterium]